MEIDDRTWYIYLLTDPTSMMPRYIGWTYDVERRIQRHISGCVREKTHKGYWLSKLIADGYSPIVTILEENTGDWASTEKYWIKLYRDNGEDLTNTTLGGEGVVGIIRKPVSEETRRKIAIACTGRVPSQETRDKISTYHTGRKKSPEAIAKQRESLLKRELKWTEERHEKHREHLKTFKMPEDAKIRIGNAHRGKIVSEETKEKLRIARRKRIISEETKQKLKGIHKGRVHTAEAKANMKSAQVKRSQEEKNGTRPPKKWSEARRKAFEDMMDRRRALKLEEVSAE